MFLQNIFGGLKRGLFGSSEHASKLNARSRLQFVLVQDRAGMSAEEMGKFKKELIGVIEKYFKMEKDKFDITYKRDGDTTTLLINSPVAFKRDDKGSFSQQNKGNNNNKKRDSQPVAAN